MKNAYEKKKGMNQFGGDGVIRTAPDGNVYRQRGDDYDIIATMEDLEKKQDLLTPVNGIAIEKVPTLFNHVVHYQADSYNAVNVSYQDDKETAGTKISTFGTWLYEHGYDSKSHMYKADIHGYLNAIPVVGAYGFATHSVMFVLSDDTEVELVRTKDVTDTVTGVAGSEITEISADATIERVTNRVNILNDSTTNYPTAHAVKAYVDEKPSGGKLYAHSIKLNNEMVAVFILARETAFSDLNDLKSYLIENGYDYFTKRLKPVSSFNVRPNSAGSEIRLASPIDGLGLLNNEVWVQWNRTVIHLVNNTIDLTVDNIADRVNNISDVTWELK